jgi:predicted O-methyltransferase YrrM
MRTEPALVAAAKALAAELEFDYSCSTGTGRLLATLAAATDGTVGESGTGCGVGTAWLRSGAPPPRRIVTAERDPVRAAAAAALFQRDRAVTVLADDWTALRGHAPFGLFFLDGGGKPDGPDAVADLVAPGGIVVMDDFTPSDGWPPEHGGQPDRLRVAWLTDPRFTAAEVRVSATESVILATRLEPAGPPVEDRLEPGDPV